MALELFGNLKDDMNMSSIELTKLGLELELDKLRPKKFLEFYKLYKEYDMEIKLIMSKNANFLAKLAELGILTVDGSTIKNTKDISEEDSQKIAEFGAVLGKDMSIANTTFNNKFVEFFMELVKGSNSNLEKEEIEFLISTNEEVLNTLIIDFKIKCNLEKSTYWEDKNSKWENANEEVESPIK